MAHSIGFGPVGSSSIASWQSDDNSGTGYHLLQTTISGCGRARERLDKVVVRLDKLVVRLVGKYMVLGGRSSFVKTTSSGEIAQTLLTIQ